MENNQILPYAKNTVKAVSFLLVLAVILLMLSYAFAPKDNTKKSGIVNPNARGFYSEPENTIDILILGNSDAYSGFSPMEIWNKYGYTSYVSAEGRSTISDSLSLLKEVMIKQKPKLVVLETDQLFFEGNQFDELSTNIASSLVRKFSVFRYHNRWKTTTFKDMLRTPDYTAHCSTKGQYVSSTVKGYKGKEYIKKTKKKKEIPFTAMRFFDNFVDYCNANNLPLLLVQVPSKTSWTFAKHNKVEELAKTKDISFLDLDVARADYGFDWRIDSRDGGNHLNCRGAKKVSLYMADYIAANYKITDHRTDPDYSIWKTDYDSYYGTVYNKTTGQFK